MEQKTKQSNRKSHEISHEIRPKSFIYFQTNIYILIFFSIYLFYSLFFSPTDLFLTLLLCYINQYLNTKVELNQTRKCLGCFPSFSVS